MSYGLPDDLVEAAQDATSPQEDVFFGRALYPERRQSAPLPLDEEVVFEEPNYCPAIFSGLCSIDGAQLRYCQVMRFYVVRAGP